MELNFVVSRLKVRVYIVPPCRSLTGARKDVSDSLEMERKVEWAASGGGQD